MTYGILPNGKQQFIDSNGKPLASGNVYYYIPSTTTFKNTYQNSAGTVLNTNPVVLDANGQCIAYGTGSYRQQVYDVYGNLVWDVQVDSPLTSGNQTYDIEEQTFTATSGQTVFTLTTMSYVPGTNNLVVFVDGLKQIVGVNYTETSATVVNFTTGLHVGTVVDFTTAVLQTNANIVPATDVTYNEGGTGAVTTTVQAKLQQTVSINDFGALTSSSNNTSAITAALAASTAVYVPVGVYNCGSSVTVPDNTTLYGPGTLNFTAGKLILSNNSIIDSLTVTGNGNTNNEDGVTGANKYGWIIRDCVVKNIQFNGIQCSGASYFTIQGTTVYNTGTSATSGSSYLGHNIHVPSANNGSIFNNDLSVSYGQASIFIDSSTSITIRGNFIHDTVWAGIRGYNTAANVAKCVIDSNRLQLIGSSNTGTSAVGCNGIANFSNPSTSLTDDVWDWIVTNNYLDRIAENGIEGSGFISGNTIYQTNYNGKTTPSTEGIYAQGPAKIVNNTIFYSNPGIRVYNDGTSAASYYGPIEITDNNIVNPPSTGYGIYASSINAGGQISRLSITNNRLFNGGVVVSAVSGGSYTASTVQNNQVFGGSGVASSVDASVQWQFNNGYGPMFASGAGAPNGVVTAPVGSIWTRTDGGASTTLYVKESGTGNTGWVAK